MENNLAKEARDLRILADQCQGRDGGAVLFEKEVIALLERIASEEADVVRENCAKWLEGTIGASTAERLRALPPEQLKERKP